jgi:hypothetical protein
LLPIPAGWQGLTAKSLQTILGAIGTAEGHGCAVNIV